MFEVLTTPVLYVNIAETTMFTCNIKHVDMAILDMCICKHLYVNTQNIFMLTEVGAPWNRVRAQARHTQR